MANGNIYMLGSNPDFTVQTDKIFARNDNSFATLLIPFKIEFSGSLRVNETNFAKAEVILFKGELRSNDSSILLGESIIMMNQTLTQTQRSFNAQFQFSFPTSIIEKIEKKRMSDMKFHIAVTGQIAEYGIISFTNNQSRSFVTGFEKPSGHVDFEIPQSQWVKILNDVGYKPLRIYELPAASHIIPEEYSKSLKELDDANKYFMAGDYDKAVAHCRSAIDPFKPKKDEIRKYVSSKSEFAWAMDILDATDVWLNKVVKSTSHFTSKTHHVPSTGHFNRMSAEIVLMITIGIVAFVGNVQQ